MTLYEYLCRECNRSRSQARNIADLYEIAPNNNWGNAIRTYYLQEGKDVDEALEMIDDVLEWEALQTIREE